MGKKRYEKVWSDSQAVSGEIVMIATFAVSIRLVFPPGLPSGEGEVKANVVVSAIQYSGDGMSWLSRDTCFLRFGCMVWVVKALVATSFAASSTIHDNIRSG